MPRPLSKWNGFVRTESVKTGLTALGKILVTGTASTCAVKLTPRAARMLRAFTNALCEGKGLAEAQNAVESASKTRR